MLISQQRQITCFRPHLRHLHRLWQTQRNAHKRLHFTLVADTRTEMCDRKEKLTIHFLRLCLRRRGNIPLCCLYHRSWSTSHYPQFSLFYFQLHRFSSPLPQHTPPSLTSPFLPLRPYLLISSSLPGLFCPPLPCPPPPPHHSAL